MTQRQFFINFFKAFMSLFFIVPIILAILFSASVPEQKAQFIQQINSFILNI